MAINPEIAEKARNAFEEKCFRLIIGAYETSLGEKMIQLDWNENDISFELYEKIETSPAKIRYKIHISPECRIPKNVPKTKGFADKLPRVDLRMSHFALRQEYKYFFESKNLKQNDSGLKRRYINTGIDNFVSGKYENGSLIGYLLEGKAKDTVDGINSLLEKDKRKSETLNTKKSKLFEFYYESNHPGIGLLKHFIFDFTRISN